MTIEEMINDLLDTQDRMLEKTKLINSKLMELADYIDDNSTIEQLLERYPNDQELGEVIRRIYNNKTNKDGNS